MVMILRNKNKEKRKTTKKKQNKKNSILKENLLTCNTLNTHQSAHGVASYTAFASPFLLHLNCLLQEFAHAVTAGDARGRWRPVWSELCAETAPKTKHSDPICFSPGLWFCLLIRSTEQTSVSGLFSRWHSDVRTDAVRYGHRWSCIVSYVLQLALKQHGIKLKTSASTFSQILFSFGPGFQFNCIKTIGSFSSCFSWYLCDKKGIM